MSDNEDQLQLPMKTTAAAAKTVHSNGDILHENSILSSNTTQPSSSSGYFINSNNLRLHFSNINYVYKQKNKILHDACGEFKSGRLTAILGPSGAGKTSMLNVLSGFKASGVSGNFLINGEERNLLEFRKMSSYIAQDFAMLDLLTVEETLKISTELKLSTQTKQKEKEQIINDILQMLNMERSRHTLVRNLSGGERKRLSIGVELVTNPPIMFFDEPTSGLDSVASFQVLTYLRRLARDGRLIVCVVHQPSSRLMQLFDDILVMSGGRVLYSGTQEQMINCFQKAGFECPQYYNPADFVLEVSSDVDNPNLRKLIDSNQSKHALKSLASSGTETMGLLTNSSSHISLDMNNLTLTAVTSSHCQLDNCTLRPKEQVTVWRQFVVLMKRSMTSMCRNMIAVQLRIIMHIVVAILLGIVFWNIGNDGAKALTNSSCIFFVVMFVFFGNAMPSIFLCPQECAVFIREYLNGWYSIKAYYMAKIVSDLPLQFICPTLLMSIAYYMTGQPHDVGRFVMCWGICLLTSIIGHFIGLVFGSMFDMQLGVFLVPGVTIPIMIFSGFFIRIYEVAYFLRFLCDISFFRYSLEGFMRALYAYDRPILNCMEDFCYYKNPAKFLKDLGMSGDFYGCDVGALLIWILVLKILFFISLVIRIKKAQ
ncbi:ATP-binding cassette sub-family G member 4 isoform X1 [Lucilia cuprina]|uniref:ATP-binding cassette sub-family G member 4 isoform X1 n=2 Tax=Lucilia cuprina TaxID=7375 RepID=UPI001F06EF69|nr:ATP-binding cassette sub-family G member 4 isoform X1 [Lucilia cuprina]